MDNYILELALRHNGVPLRVIKRGDGAIAILMTDGRKVEFTAGQVLSAQMKDRAHTFTEQRGERAKTQAQQKKQEAIDAYNAQVERVTTEKTRKARIAAGPLEPAKPTPTDSAEV